MNQCSWMNLEPATMHFCEELMCGHMLIQPSNAISSLGFVLIGILLWKKISEKSIYLLFPISAILVGITSFLYHASWTFFFQIFDVSSMFMLSCLLLSFNLWRLKVLKKKFLSLFYVISLLLSTSLMVLIKGQSGEIIFSIEVALVVLSELILFFKKDGTTYKYFHYAFGTFLLAFTIWILDVKEIVCDKHNHFLQGHSAWHLLNAVCFYFLYKFYIQFKDRKDL